jgi:type I restriction enzyme R subunit
MSERIKVSVATSFWANEERLKIDKSVKPLIDAFMINDIVKKTGKLEELTRIAEFVISYVNDDAGVDWEMRDSIKARMRTRGRRRLSKIHFDEDSIEEAANAVVEKAAQFTLFAKKEAEVAV